MKNHDLKVNMNEYLPLRDVVFNTLRQASLKGELESAGPLSARQSESWSWRGLSL